MIARSGATVHLATSAYPSASITSVEATRREAMGADGREALGASKDHPAFAATARKEVEVRGFGLLRTPSHEW